MPNKWDWPGKGGREDEGMWNAIKWLFKGGWNTIGPGKDAYVHENGKRGEEMEEGMREVVGMQEGKTEEGKGKREMEGQEGKEGIWQDQELGVPGKGLGAGGTPGYLKGDDGLAELFGWGD